MKRKVIISISLFLFLFVGAWYMNEQTNRDYIRFVIKDTDAVVEYIFTPLEAEAEEVEIWNFKAREYIKVRKRIE